MMKPLHWLATLLLLLLPLLLWQQAAHSDSPPVVQAPVPEAAPPAPARQTQEQALAKSAGCESCHRYGPSAAGNPAIPEHRTMHANPAVVLGCTDCHGGNAMVRKPAAAERGDKAFEAAMAQAHVLPRDPLRWGYPSSANPAGSYTMLNREHPAFIRFMNPGDLRVAREACGACHLPTVQAVERSLMATSAMLWGGASYNNGIVPFKRYILGESYTAKSEPAQIKNPTAVTPHMTEKGILPELLPLPAWETVPPADVFRVFERGGRVINSQFPEVGLPNVTGAIQRLDEPGRPDIKQSNRGPGTGSRIAVPLINITKTRLNDPHLWFLGTNDQPGDYRSSGCTACHTPYANDRDPKHSGPYAVFGHEGQSASSDPSIPKGRAGHPISHQFTRAIPSSQCMVCHMHQPNIFVNSFYGTTMWDYEADAPFMWPRQQKYPTAEESRRILERNPEEAATRGLWGDPEFSKRVSELNPQLKDTQFADYHGHGWNFRAIFKRDRKGTLVDKNNQPVADNDPDKFKKAVHLSSVHMDIGMQCVDCHFAQDAHGNGHIYGEVAAAVEVDCKDCHGTAKMYPSLFTSGPAARPGGMDMQLLRTQDGRKRFDWRDGKLYQRSAVDPKLEWEMSLVKDTVTPGHPRYNEKAARAKLMRAGADGQNGLWGLITGAAADGKGYAHDDEAMSCHSCHLSWTTSCAGCHLPIQANAKTERKHYEGGETRNYATYNPQVVREDMFQLGRAGPVKGGKITPIRSSSALILSSTNANRERIYIQQPPVAASGFSSQAFAPHYPHTERKTETKTCTDCHLSAADDNNAIMAQLLLQGTNFVNFVGFNAWVGAERHIEAVQVTEWDEPQSVIGSYLQRYAYPDWYSNHQKAQRRLQTAFDHRTRGAASCLQLRGEYLYVAEGAGGMRVYDVASIANKGVSQRIVTAPFSPLGQGTHIASNDASCVALPTNQPIAPERNSGELMRKTNQEQPFHPIYHYAFVSDRKEGLIVVNVDTLADGEPRNNFLRRALTWNAGGVLEGARHLTVAGHYLYVSTPRGLVVVDIDDPLQPRHVATVPLQDARASALQFRYLWVTTSRGLEVLDVSDPKQPRHLPESTVALADARKVYVARTYAYVAAGAEGLVIVDVERPRQPRIHTRVQQGDTPETTLSDAQDVVVGSTNASLFAYVADGARGLKVLQLTAPDTQPRFYGFSPAPKPQVIAWRETSSPALALSKGLDRDRAVDETGGQIAVFGRIGSRPFTAPEMRKLYLRADGTPWTVTDTPGTSYSNVGEPAPVPVPASAMPAVASPVLHTPLVPRPLGGSR